MEGKVLRFSNLIFQITLLSSQRQQLKRTIMVSGGEQTLLNVV